MADMRQDTQEYAIAQELCAARSAVLGDECPGDFLFSFSADASISPLYPSHIDVAWQHAYEKRPHGLGVEVRMQPLLAWLLDLSDFSTEHFSLARLRKIGQNIAAILETERVTNG